MAPTTIVSVKTLYILVEPAQPQLLWIDLTGPIRRVSTTLMRLHMPEAALATVTAGPIFLVITAHSDLRRGTVRVGLSRGPEVLAGLLLRGRSLGGDRIDLDRILFTPVFLRF